MTTRAILWLLVFGAWACGGGRHRQVLGPPPEYEPTTPPIMAPPAGPDGGTAPREGGAVSVPSDAARG